MPDSSNARQDAVGPSYLQAAFREDAIMYEPVIVVSYHSLTLLAAVVDAVHSVPSCCCCIQSCDRTRQHHYLHWHAFAADRSIIIVMLLLLLPLFAALVTAFGQVGISNTALLL